jgi:hypothetical protein
MKKEEFKQLIKESVKEVLLTEGFLSTIVSEVVKGIGNTVITERVTIATPDKSEENTSKNNFRKAKQQDQVRKLQETKKKMLDAIGKNAYGGVDVFEGTKPISKGAASPSNPAPNSPLGDVEPDDPGVDISDLLGGSAVWKQLIK